MRSKPDPVAKRVQLRQGWRARLADNLAAARHFAKLTQLQLGDMLGVSQCTISRIETEIITPSARQLLLWAIACRIHAHLLFEGIA